MDVFVSYSAKDTEFAKKMCAIIKSHGISYWAAYENPSESNTNTTVNQICNARVFLVFVSKNSNQSKHVINEINCASMYNKPILPVIIDDVEISHAFEYYIAGSNRLYYSQSTDFIEPFIYMLRSMIDSGNASLVYKNTEHTAEKTEPPKDRKIKKTPIIITAIVALLAVATAVAVVLIKIDKKPTSGSVSDADSVTEASSASANDSASATDYTAGEETETLPNNTTGILDYIIQQDNTETVTANTQNTTDKTTAATTNKNTKPTTAKPTTTAKKPTTTTTKAPVSKPSAKPTGKDLLIGDWNAKMPVDNISICLTCTFKADGTVKIDLTRDNYNQFMMSITKIAVDGLTDKEIAEQGFSSREEAINAYLGVVILSQPYEDVRSTYNKSGQWTLNGDTLTLQLSGHYPIVIKTELSKGKASFAITQSDAEMYFTKIN